jgi:hypothetical protein
MDPIVHGVMKRYLGCLSLVRVNFHSHTPWHEKIFPLATPEFALLDSSDQILYRWFGYTEPESFDSILKPLCQS